MTLPHDKKEIKLKEMKRPLIQTEITETQVPGSPERNRLKMLLHPRTVHGGPESKGKRKTKRPFVEGAPLHVVLSSDRAKGTWSLSARKNRARISSMIHVYAARFKVRLYRMRIDPRQIQLLVKASERKHLADFLRVLAGRVAIHVTGAKKAVRRTGKFWSALCWSKIINWGREFFRVGAGIFSKNVPKKNEESDEPLHLSLEEGLP
jgi:REP element-mobilizing transposase RayT